MKKAYSIIAVIVVMTSACTKQPTELLATGESKQEESTGANSFASCFGDTWEATDNFVGNTAAVSVVYQNKVYFFNNVPADHPYNDKITIYDGTSWLQMPSAIPFDPTYIGFEFVIGDKAYFGHTQYVGSFTHKCYEYDFATNAWSPTADYPGALIIGPAFFVINNKGYVLGNNNETWEFNPSASTRWTRKTDYPGPERNLAEGFSINGKGYLVNGIHYSNNNGQVTNTYLKSLYEYNPANNSWALKASFPGAARERSQAFAISSYGYVGGGNNSEVRFIDFYRYDPADNEWLRTADYNPTGILLTCFAINSRGYAVWADTYNAPKKMKKYTPRTCIYLPQ